MGTQDIIKYLKAAGLTSQILVMIPHMRDAKRYLRTASSVILKPFKLHDFRMEIERLLLFLMESDDSETEMSGPEASFSHSAFSSDEESSSDEGGLDFL